MVGRTLQDYVERVCAYSSAWPFSLEIAPLPCKKILIEKSFFFFLIGSSLTVTAVKDGT